MLLKKITIVNSVRYIPISEETKETDIKTKKIKAGSLTRKQNRKISENNKNSLKMWQHVDLETLSD